MQNSMRTAVAFAAILSESLFLAKASASAPPLLPDNGVDAEVEACEMQTSLLQTTRAEIIAGSLIDARPGLQPARESQVAGDSEKDDASSNVITLSPTRPSCRSTALDLASIELHIIAWRRPKSLLTLLSELKSAPYRGWEKEIPLHIHVDGGADGLVADTALGYRWPHGPVHLDIRKENAGLRAMWLTSLTTAAKLAGPNTLMIVLEDDMRVSPLYFQGLMRMIRTYARNPDCREPSLMGISLSPIRMQELRKPFTRWHAETLLNTTGGKVSNAFLSSVPSSWGSAYFTDRWLEFAPFVELRLQHPYYDVEAERKAKIVGNYDELRMTPKELYIPNGCRSNVWPQSWKRFMVDFMFARGALMLYPSLPDESALASTLQLSGSHVSAKKDGKQTLADEAGDSGIRDPVEEDMKRNPRVAPLLESKRGVLKDLHFPSFDELLVTDLFLELATRKSVVEAGAKFIEGVAGHREFAELAQAWRR